MAGTGRVQVARAATAAILDAAAHLAPARGTRGKASTAGLAQELRRNLGELLESSSAGGCLR